MRVVDFEFSVCQSANLDKRFGD